MPPVCAWSRSNTTRPTTDLDGGQSEPESEVNPNLDWGWPSRHPLADEGPCAGAYRGLVGVVVVFRVRGAPRPRSAPRRPHSAGIAAGGSADHCQPDPHSASRSALPCGPEKMGVRLGVRPHAPRGPDMAYCSRHRSCRPLLAAHRERAFTSRGPPVVTHLMAKEHDLMEPQARDTTSNPIALST